MSDLTDALVEMGAPPPPPDSVWWWGVVTATAPLRIRKESEVDDLPLTPRSLVALAVGDLVWVQNCKGRLVIHGKKVL